MVMLTERILAMVDENAVMIEAELTGYVQYEDSDCLNGGIIRVKDGRKFVDEVVSHHYVIISGHHRPAFEMLAGVFDYELEVI